MSNTATPGIRGFNRAWVKQPSGNLKRVFGDVEIILRKRDNLYEVHAFKGTDKRVFATRLSSTTMFYWRNDDTCKPARMTLRSARELIDRRIEEISKALE